MRDSKSLLESAIHRDIAYLERNTLALVYEADDYNQIIFERINLNK